MILPSPSSPTSYESTTDFSSCATTSSNTTAPTASSTTTEAAFRRQRTIGGGRDNDSFSGSKNTTNNYHSSSTTSICTQAESSVSSSSGSAANEPSDENDDNNRDESSSPVRRYAIVPPPCLKIKTAKESLSRLHNYGFGHGSSLSSSSSSGKRALAMLTALSTSAFSLSPPKHVQFSNVTVHLHGLILGDHPSVSEGPPLMLDWKAFESIAYETVDDFQENKEPQLHEDPRRQRQLQRKRPITETMHSVISTAATGTTPRVPPPLLKNNAKRKWPAHQRRNYLKNKLGVTGTDILRVEFEVRRIQLSRKTEARSFAMEQFLAARRLLQDANEDYEDDFHNNSSSHHRRAAVAPIVQHRGVSPVVVDESAYALRRYYGNVGAGGGDEYRYPYDSSLLDDDDDNDEDNDDDGILADAKNTVPEVPEGCLSNVPRRRQQTYTTMPAGCWHPAKEGKGWFISGGPQAHSVYHEV
jgi:hypothetical protein